MPENMRELGVVKLVQLQPDGLIIKNSSGYFFDVSRRVQVGSLMITSRGIEALAPDGGRVLDIHHLDHPGKAYGEDDLVCIGFTSHYKAMRSRFGDHMVDGSAGENIIIEYEREVWPEDLGKQIAIENRDTGHRALLNMVSIAAPCEEFSRFAARSQDIPLQADSLKKTLKFLGNGRRGYLLVLSPNQGTVTVRAGDRVFALDGG